MSKKKKKYKSDLLHTIHNMAESLHKAGGISDEKMKEFDNNCLVREKEKVE